MCGAACSSLPFRPTPHRLQVRDLLSKDPKNKLEVKEHKDSGVYVKGLNAFVVKGVAELKNVLDVSSGGLAIWKAAFDLAGHRPIGGPPMPSEARISSICRGHDWGHGKLRGCVHRTPLRG